MFKEPSNDGTEILTQSALEGELKYPAFYGVLKTLVCKTTMPYALFHINNVIFLSIDEYFGFMRCNQCRRGK